MSMKPNSPIDINTAGVEELISRLEISPELARRFVLIRPFRSFEQFQLIFDNEKEIIERILPLIQIGSETLPVQVEPPAVEEQISPVEQATPAEPIPSPEQPPLEQIFALGQDEAPGPSAPAEQNAAEEQIASLDQITSDEQIAAEAQSAGPEEIVLTPTSPGISTNEDGEQVETKRTARPVSKLNLALFFIILFAAYFRFVGLNWDDNHHLHPDERFISMVSDQIKPVGSIAAYFDTATSTLNPLTQGSYAYGMLPLFITRAVAEWLKMTDYDRVTLVGRAMSGFFDLLALWMLYLLGKRLYNKKIGVLAAGLYAAAVFPIQMSHFFTVDSFATVFVVAAVYLALRATSLNEPDARLGWKKLVFFGLFGLDVGMAGACKINALPVLGIIVLAGIVHIIITRKRPEFPSQWKIVISGWTLAILFAFLAFRVFQPYAFSGTGFLGSGLNPKWVDVIKEVTGQVAGLSDWPPNTHWTSRPASYAWLNMVLWGMGLSLGLAGWAGWAWAAKRMWNGEWRRHLLPFVWVLTYFVWQNLQFWRYMRYFILIYPFIILFAAWALIEIYEKTAESRLALSQYKFEIKHPTAGFRSIWKGLSAITLIGLVLLITYAYAFGFTQIYTRPITRLAASNWMIKNIEGPLNLKVNTAVGQDSYPIFITNQWVLVPGDTPQIDFHEIRNGTADAVTSTNISQVGVNIYFRISKKENGDDILTEGRLPIADDDPGGKLEITFGDITLAKDTPYYFIYKISSNSRFSLSSAVLKNETDSSPVFSLDLNIQDQTGGTQTGTQTVTFSADTRLNRLDVGSFQQTFAPSQTTLKVSLLKDGDNNNPLASATQTLAFSAPGASLAPTFKFPAAQLLRGATYQVRYEILDGGPIQILGENYALETSWDDALPMAVNGFDPLGGIYKPFNLELFDTDTPAKRTKMIDILTKSDYVVISSNRAYDSMPRLTYRYPLTIRYYQELFGCNCMGDQLENTAYDLQPGFVSPLGFKLVASFVSNPSIGPFVLNDQSADESFTVYDHPKVMIFKKTAEFSVDHLTSVLNSVNLDNVLFQTPLQFTKAPLAMQLPADRLAAQTNGGTWSDMFSRLSPVNTSQTYAIFAWYLLLFGLGLLVFPLVWSIFPGLPDRGYPLARMAALLLIAWLAWCLSSLQLLPFTAGSILLCMALIAAVSIFFAVRHKGELLHYAANNWLHILATEVLFLLVFLLMLNIKIGNPDLWNPWLGGEKPMDFAFFNATLKTVYFPPESPWFSGHYLNYYYFGYVVASIPTKLTAILPSTAYNLILPSWFAMTGIGVFCIGYNLVAGLRTKTGLRGTNSNFIPDIQAAISKVTRRWAYFAGVFALLAVIIFGNFYEVNVFVRNIPNMIPQGWLDANPDNQQGGEIAGVQQVLTGQAQLPGDRGQWYFEASRPILNNQPDAPIEEFPYFTFLYGDLHAHMLTMLFYALAFGWMLSMLIHPIVDMKLPEKILSLIMAAIFIGSFWGSNSWDFLPFLGLATLVLSWSVWKTSTAPIKPTILKIAGFAAVFVGLTILFYLPFSYWFKTDYLSLILWTGMRTPLTDYLVVFGLSLFIMISLMVRDCAADVEEAYRHWLKSGWRQKFTLPVLIIITLAAAVVLWKFDYQVLAFGLFMLIGMIYLIFFKRSQSMLKKVAWLLYAVGFLLTLMVEVIVLQGDAGRSNMVFRMYNEAWFYVGLSSCMALTVLLPDIRRWPLWVAVAWVPVLAILVILSLSYPYLATGQKMADRWPGIVNPPHTLNGMDYMMGEADFSAPAVYDDDGRKFDISLDYPAIRYLQENVKGTPVIAEGQTSEYRWGSRISVYTGLPSIIGWSWHIRQHNSLLDGAWIDKRIQGLDDFYNSTDPVAAMKYINENNVQYIVVGDLERGYYHSDGLAKFHSMVAQGQLRIAFGDDTSDITTIYQVLNPAKQ